MSIRTYYIPTCRDKKLYSLNLNQTKTIIPNVELVFLTLIFRFKSSQKEDVFGFNIRIRNSNYPLNLNQVGLTENISVKNEIFSNFKRVKRHTRYYNKLNPSGKSPKSVLAGPAHMT